MNKNFATEALKLDAKEEATRICKALSQCIRKQFKRHGAVVGLSGGIDSSLTAALCVEALGKEHVLGLLMPERDSSQDTLSLSQAVANHLGIETLHEDITDILDLLKCYKRQEDAVRSVVPEFSSSDKFKIVLPSVLDHYTFRVFSVVVQFASGEERKTRLTPEAYLALVAATNFKQRVRKMLEYHHADRLNYAVAGTPNRLEYDQGFFVKLGDGAADVKPIAHLYKTQVYTLARYFKIPEEICSRPPTTDTYSLSQSQEEFYFSLPYEKMDLCLYGIDHDIAPEDIAACINLLPEQVERVYVDIRSKRKATRYLHGQPVLFDRQP